MSEQKQLTIVDDPAPGLSAMIERLAANPDVPVDKLERLLAMQREVMAKQAEDAFNAAMIEAQSEMRPIATDAVNNHTSSRYATFEKMDRALRPIYNKHGFGLSFSEGDTPKPDHIRVLCFVTHRGGHTRIYPKDVSTDNTGPQGKPIMNKAQASGNAQSYGMRYLLKGIFNVAIGEDDDDGNMGAGGAPTITTDQIAALQRLMDEVGIVGPRKDKMFETWKITKLGDIKARDFEACRKIIEGKRKA